MRKFFAVAVLALAVAAIGFATPATRSDVPLSQVQRAAIEVIKAGATRIAAQDQTPTTPTPSAEDQAAFEKFQQFAEDHMLDGLGRYRSSDGKTVTGFDLALFTVDADGNDSEEPKWVVYNYPTVAAAAAQIESDFTKYPDGHQTTYTTPDSKEKKA